jgi:hypothetical protein
VTSFAPVVLIAAALAVAPLHAQPRPDFSGTWTLDRDRSETPQQTETFQPVTVVITQSATEVTIETQRGGDTTRAVYPLVADAKPPAQGTGVGSPTAYWERASLVTAGSRTVQGQTVSVRESRTLEPNGRDMTVKTLLVVQHGYTLRGAQNYGAATDVYVRKAP